MYRSDGTRDLALQPPAPTLAQAWWLGLVVPRLQPGDTSRASSDDGADMPLAVLKGQQQPDRSRTRTECAGAAQLSSWAAKLKTREAGLDEKPPEEAPRTPNAL